MNPIRHEAGPVSGLCSGGGGGRDEEVTTSPLVPGQPYTGGQELTPRQTLQSARHSIPSDTFSWIAQVMGREGVRI